MNQLMTAEQLARLSKFKLEKAIYVEYSNTKGNIQSVVYRKVDDDNTIDNIVKYFTGDDNGKIDKDDKVYIMPDHPISLYKIKEIIKNCDAKITKDPTKATCILGHDEIFADFVARGNLQAKFATLGFSDARWTRHVDMNDFKEYYQNDNTWSESLYRMYGIKEETLLSEKHIIVSDLVTSNHGVNRFLERENDNVYYLREELVQLLYYGLSNKLKVISPVGLAKNASTKVKLSDADTFASIDAMMSGDHSDRQVAFSLLSNIDTNNAIEELWKIARDHGYALINERNKDVQWFCKTYKISKLRSIYDSEDFLEYCVEEDLLTGEIFKNHISKCLEQYKRNLASTSFFDIEIKIKPEYEKFTD